MAIRFHQGEIARLLLHFNMQPARKGSNTHLGIGGDGRLRRCYFHFHSKGTPVATGTAAAIAKQLGFDNALKMKEYMDRYL